MEQTQTDSLFSLSIDPVTKAHLHETAKWGRFLAIVGFIFLVLMIVAGIFLSTIMANTMGGMDATGMGSNYFAGFGVGMAVLYIILAVIWFFPLLFLLRFSNRMRTALAGNDQQALNVAFQNLKICFRYVGIITIIILAIYAIAVVFGIMGAAMFS
jgi:hypothetical protein